MGAWYSTRPDVRLHRPEVHHDDVAHAVVAPYRRLPQDIVDIAGQHHSLNDLTRNLRRLLQNGPLIDGERDMVLHSREVGTHRMDGTVMRVELRGPVQRPRLHGGRFQGDIHFLAVGRGETGIQKAGVIAIGSRPHRMRRPE